MQTAIYRKITVDLHGEILELKPLHDGLPSKSFASEVTRVAREWEGRNLGGQAEVNAFPVFGRILRQLILWDRI